MPIQIIRHDITKMQVDAIVNAANSSLLGGGGVDGAIHRAAGPELLEACRKLNGCEVGEAKWTLAYRLPCQYVIHTVGPVWQNGHHREKQLLASCYRRSLEIACEKHCETVAFPLISAGAYGYPKDQALKVAMESICGFLNDHDLWVYLVVFDREAFEVSGKLLGRVQSYIDDVYVQRRAVARNRLDDAEGASVLAPAQPLERSATKKAVSLEDMLEQVDEGFSQMLIRKIDEKEMTDAECYRLANVDRRLFNKIKNHPEYHPSKQTVLAFAVALQLDLQETQELLMKAGFALTHSSKGDIVVEYCITHGEYNIFEINEVLFKLDLQPLGY